MTPRDAFYAALDEVAAISRGLAPPRGEDLHDAPFVVRSLGCPLCLGWAHEGRLYGLPELVAPNAATEPADRDVNGVLLCRFCQLDVLGLVQTAEYFGLTDYARLARHVHPAHVVPRLAAAQRGGPLGDDRLRLGPPRKGEPS